MPVWLRQKAMSLEWNISKEKAVCQLDLTKSACAGLDFYILRRLVSIVNRWLRQVALRCIPCQTHQRPWVRRISLSPLWPVKLPLGVEKKRQKKNRESDDASSSEKVERDWSMSTCHRLTGTYIRYRSFSTQYYTAIHQTVVSELKECKIVSSIIYKESKD